MGRRGYLILTDYCWETEKPFRPEPAWAQPGILSLLISMPSGSQGPTMYKALGIHLLIRFSRTSEPPVLPHFTNNKKRLREAKDMSKVIQSLIQAQFSLLLDLVFQPHLGAIGRREEDGVCECGMWVHFPLKGAQGGLSRGDVNGTSTAVFDSTLGGADPASQAPKMLPWGASS